MFINYLRLNLIRFFKGRSARVTFFVSAGVSMFFLLFIQLIFGAGRDRLLDRGVEMDPVQLNQSFLLGMSFIDLPLIIGIVGCGFICTYYAYRSYYNLEIGMRSRTLFCLSELVVLFVLSTIATVAMILPILLMEVFSDSPNTFFSQSPIFFFTTVMLLIFLGFNNSANALFASKLFRQRGKSMIFYILLSIFSILFATMLPGSSMKSMSALEYIIFPNFITWFHGDMPMFLQEDAVRITVAVSSLCIKVVFEFIMSVLLFSRKIEEKRK